MDCDGCEGGELCGMRGRCEEVLYIVGIIMGGKDRVPIPTLVKL